MDNRILQTRPPAGVAAAGAGDSICPRPQRPRATLASPSPRRPPPPPPGPLRQPLCGCARPFPGPWRGALRWPGAACRWPRRRRPLPPAPGTRPLTLRKSPALQETIPESVRTQLPVFVTGDRISGQTDLNAVIEGNAELRRGDTVIRADRLDYNVPDDLAKARGNVRINRAGNVYEGSALELRVECVRRLLHRRALPPSGHGAHGEATGWISSTATARWCTTPPTPPASAITKPAGARLGAARRPHPHRQRGRGGHGRGAVLEFKGVPLLPIPYISFPLSDKRKSGCCRPPSGWTASTA
jgi:LPS-assembly protein